MNPWFTVVWRLCPTVVRRACLAAVVGRPCLAAAVRRPCLWLYGTLTAPDCVLARPGISVGGVSRGRAQDLPGCPLTLVRGLSPRLQAGGVSRETLPLLES
jgi:hypothetical protein